MNFFPQLYIMNKEIDSIFNLTTTVILDETGSWTINGGFPTTPDEIVIRQLTYIGMNPNPAMYSIHSDINHSVIGTVANSSVFIANPQTRIHLKSPLQSQLTFRLLQGTTPVVIDLANDDMISISMDFIKYR